MDAGAIARFADITAYGDTFHGVGWHFTDLEGWTESPEVDMQAIERPGTHGMLSLPAYLRRRVVRIPGFFVGKDIVDREEESARLRSLITREIQLVIEDPIETLWVQGRVTEARFVNRGFAPEGDWRLTVDCADPRKYGTPRDFPGGSSAAHYGNFPAIPLLLIGAGSGGYTINGPGGRVITVATAPAAAHMIDLASGGLFLNGVRQVGAITRYEPWMAPVGAPGVTATITGARTLVQRVFDTFI